MPIINGVKYACEPCMRGHRSSKCTHGDRILIRVRKPGRPLSSCPHETGSCSCEVTRVAIPKVSSCKCGTSSKFNESGETSKRRKVIGQALNAERKAAAAAQLTKSDDLTSVLDPALEGKGGCCSSNNVGAAPASSSSCCKPKAEEKLNGSSSCCAPGSGSNGIAKENGTSNGEADSSAESNGDGISSPYVPGGHYQDSPTGFPKPTMFRRPSAPSWDPKHPEFQMPYPRERYNSRDETESHVMPNTAMGSILLHGHEQAKHPSQRLPFQVYQSHVPQHGYPIMQQSNYFPGHVENVQFLNPQVALGTPTPGEHNGTPQNGNGFFNGDYSPAAAHECNCGPSCNCLGCATHPFNKKTLDYVRSMREALGGMSYPGSEDVDSSSSRISSPHILPHAGLHISSPTGSTFKENGYHPDAPPPVAPAEEDDFAVSRRESLAQPNSTSEDGLAAPASEFFHIDYRLGCCSEGSNCHCGEGCTCVGCLTHGGHNGVNLSPEGITQVLNGAQLEARFSES